MAVQRWLGLLSERCTWNDSYRRVSTGAPRQGIAIATTLSFKSYRAVSVVNGTELEVYNRSHLPVNYPDCATVLLGPSFSRAKPNQKKKKSAATKIVAEFASLRDPLTFLTTTK